MQHTHLWTVKDSEATRCSVRVETVDSRAECWQFTHRQSSTPISGLSSRARPQFPHGHCSIPITGKIAHQGTVSVQADSTVYTSPDCLAQPGHSFHTDSAAHPSLDSLAQWD
ncbi:hypothetical protein BaRGS_00034234 [Batillaria attramentaria]|uniref:Uncharacterized protein n=1 Tax=Batillaria attramentaria TaxID=370345 RepID=A0ABD0JII3_9CAEN